MWPLQCNEATSSSFLDGFVLQLGEAPHVELRHAGLVVGEALREEVEVLEAGTRHQILGRGFHSRVQVQCLGPRILTF